MALDAEIRIPDTTLQDNDFKDGEILRGSDVNKIVSVLKAGVNENYKDLKESDTISNEHILDEVRHITGQERDRWNNTYTKEELYTKEEVYNKSEVYNKNETYPKESLYTKEETYSKNETYPKENLYTKNEVYKKSETYPKESLYTKNEVYAKEEVYTKGETYSKNDVYTKDNVYTKSEVDQQINDRITAIGSADMQKAVYDTNSNGIVDNSERLGGQLPSHYATKTEVDTKLGSKADKTEVSELRTDVSELQDKSYEVYNDESTLETNGSLIRNMVIYGKSVQDGTPTHNNPIEIQSVVNPKVTVCGKNLLRFNATSKTVNGVTFTVNTDGSITAIGTATANIEFKVNDWVDTSNPLPNGTYTISGDALLNKIVNGKFKGSWSNTTFTITDDTKAGSCYIYVNASASINKTIFSQIEKGTQATQYEPSQEQTATLPYTLNAIPVSDGGNVTIDGQQYISDYVDIENKKLVRMVGDVNLENFTWENYDLFSICKDIPNIKYTASNTVLGKALAEKYVLRIGKGMSTSKSYELAIDVSAIAVGNTDNKPNLLPSGKFLYELATPTETTLTDEEVSQFKALQTYVPTSSIIASSDVLSPKVEFNYNFSKGIDDLYRSDIDIKSDVSDLQSDISLIQGTIRNESPDNFYVNGKVTIYNTSQQGLTNAPTTGGYFSYITFSYGNYGVQLAIDRSNKPKIFARRFNGGTWVDWVQYGSMSYDSSTNTLNITM